MRDALGPLAHSDNGLWPHQRYALSGHEFLDAARRRLKSPKASEPRLELPGGLRKVVADSWRRSLSLASNPDAEQAPLVWGEEALERYRAAHPLAAVMPAIRQLLVNPSRDCGLLVAVGDAQGRLLWVEGDRALRSRAETMMFVEGSDWSESAVGTNAPGTALAVGAGVQIAGAEHFNRSVHSLNCTAVPIRDPDTGRLLGVLDITGNQNAIAQLTLGLLNATVATVQAQLQLERIKTAQSTAAVNGSPVSRPAPGNAARLSVLGRDLAVLEHNGQSLSLSARHSEILLLLAQHPQGLSAGQLCDGLYLEDASTVTLRAELVRLRKTLSGLLPGTALESRPYRLKNPLEVDALRVLAQVDRGAHRQALEDYTGAVLPQSQAPGVVTLRERVSQTLREALLAEGSVDALLHYAALPEAVWDAEVRLTALRLLPPRSPRRAAVVAELMLIEHEGR